MTKLKIRRCTPFSKEVGNDLEGDNERADNHYLSNKVPPNVEFTCAEGDLEEQDYQNILDFQKQDELASPLALFQLVYQIVEFTNVQAKGRKATVHLNSQMKSLDCFLQFCF